MSIAQQQMIAEQSKSSDGKGGTMDIIGSPVKFDVNFVEQGLGGGIQGAAQGMGGFFGALGSNVSSMVGLESMQAVGNPFGKLMSEMRELNQTLQNKGWHSAMEAAQEMWHAGASPFENQSPAIQISPDVTPHAGIARGSSIDFD